MTFHFVNGILPRDAFLAFSSAAMLLLAPFGEARATDVTSSKSEVPRQTPEIRLVDAYDAWYLGGGYEGNMDKLREGLRKYITADTVLHEPVSLPWGGTMVGYDGWVRLTQIMDPLFGPLAARMEVSAPQYYQQGNIVLREASLTIKPSKATEKPFTTRVMEKYTIEKGRIRQIDEFWADTASLLDEFAVLGVLHAQQK